MEDELPGSGVGLADVYLLGEEDLVEKGVEAVGSGVLLADEVGVEVVAIAEEDDCVAGLAELTDLLEGIGAEADEHGVPCVADLSVGGLNMADAADGIVELGGRDLAVGIESEIAASGVAIADWAFEGGHSEPLERGEREAGIDGIEDVAEVEDLEFFVGEDVDGHGRCECVEGSYLVFERHAEEELVVVVVLGDELRDEASLGGLGGESVGVGKEPPEGFGLLTLELPSIEDLADIAVGGRWQVELGVDVGEIGGVHDNLAIGGEEFTALGEEVGEIGEAAGNADAIHEKENGIVAALGLEREEIGVGDLLDATVGDDIGCEGRNLECLDIVALALEDEGVAACAGPDIEDSTTRDAESPLGVPLEALGVLEKELGGPNLVVEAVGMDDDFGISVAVLIGTERQAEGV